MKSDRQVSFGVRYGMVVKRKKKWGAAGVNEGGQTT